jgi:hypothetical protein
VIDRETEATLAVIGCSPLLDARGRGAILFDIGGGSTELVRIERDPGRAECAAADQGVDVDPARRRHAGRAFRRQGRHGGILRADGASFPAKAGNPVRRGLSIYR